MKKIYQELLLAAGLLGFSFLAYELHYVFFRDMHHILIYFVGDIAFLGVQALLAYFAIDRLLNYREKQGTYKKLNMLAGIFFYDLGINVFDLLTSMVHEPQKCLPHVCVSEQWDKEAFKKNKKCIPNLQLSLRYDPATARELAKELHRGKDLIIRLMENPSLHEHEVFSDMLLALFHLTEELLRRDSLQDNSAEDKEHLANDMKRAYIFLAQLWLEYMQHLKGNYGYLYLYNIKNRQLNIATSNK